MSIIFVYTPPTPPPLTFDDDFTGDNESSWNSEKWTADGANNSVNDINNNRGRQSIASGAHLAQMNNNVQFPGNLDIQIDWFKILGPSTNWWTGAVIAAVLDGPNAGWEYSMIRLYSAGQKLRSDLRTPTHTWYEFANSTGSGKFRITREGTTMKGFYWNGDSWVDPWDNWPDTSGTIEISLATKNGTSYPATTIEWDNLISV